MAKSLEIEYKSLLTTEEYFSLFTKYIPNSQKGINQTNYYFDTESNQIKLANCSLRIRQLVDSAEVTLKAPHPDGKIETTDFIMPSQKELIFKEAGLSLTPEVNQALKKLGINPLKLVEIGSLSTKRYEQNLTADILLVLDESWYNKKHDYELEMEFSTTVNSENYFKEFLKLNNIDFKKAKGKIHRMFSTL